MADKYEEQPDGSIVVRLADEEEIFTFLLISLYPEPSPFGEPSCAGSPFAGLLPPPPPPIVFPSSRIANLHHSWTCH
jgi:hypothetical protein